MLLHGLNMVSDFFHKFHLAVRESEKNEEEEGTNLGENARARDFF